jgi:ATP-dependent DNA helicase DinG
MPVPKDREFSQSAATALATLLSKTGRSILALFTSYSMLHETRELLDSEHCSEAPTVMAQGFDGEKESITRAFADGSCRLLMGTASFWEGVDFPGEQLEILVLVRLPFSVPTDPLVSALAERIETHEQNAFSSFFLPEAQLRFKQGIGRLIRRETDRGALVVLDPRLAHASYGKSFQRTLPVQVSMFESIEELADDVCAFLERG